MRKIGIVTVGRSDYGLYYPLLKKISSRPDLKLLLYVTGMHLSPEHGNTIEMIQKDSFPITAKVDMLLASDLPLSIAKSMGIGTMGFAQVFEDHKPDILVVLGDRFEMHAAAIASIPFNIPIAHIHGGELTYGAFDDYFRHSLTKLSHLHFASTQVYADRIKRMGEEPWRVIVSGAPGLDNILGFPRLKKKELEQRYGLDLSKPIILVTFHPVTREYEMTENYIIDLLKALEGFTTFQIIFTCPNADMGNKIIVEHIKQFVQGHHAFMINNFGQQAYLSVLENVSVMVGNSSSGIIEAASFKLPVVNIGNRQAGRIKAKNVIDVGYSVPDIESGIKKAVSKYFLNSIQDIVNPYGDGKASDCIATTLETIDLERLQIKKFCD